MTEFQQTVREVQEAANKMTNGDRGPYVAHWLHSDPVSLMGAWGGHEEGWATLDERFSWVEQRFGSGSAMAYEPILGYVGTDLAYTVGIERGTANADGVTAPMVIRVTHIFRREGDEWKLVHRHADFGVEKQGPPQTS